MLLSITAVVGAAAAGHPLPLAQAAGFVAVTTWSTAVPDVDHNNARIRYACPPVHLLYVAVRAVVGAPWSTTARRRVAHWMGHRRITHSILFAVVLGAVAGAAGLLLVAADLAALIGSAVTLGCLAHIAGDSFTVHGCPLLAPFSWRDRGPRWCRTGRWSERLFHRIQVALTVLVAVPVLLGHVALG